MDGKKCSNCGEWKELSEFNRNKTAKDKLSYRCKKCQNEYCKAYGQKIKESRKDVPKEKKCSVCKKMKSAEMFYKNSHHKDGLQVRCKACADNYRRSVIPQPKVIPEEKRCLKCRKIKPAIEFSRNFRGKGGLSGHCKDCRKLYNLKIKAQPKVIPEEKMCSRCGKIKPRKEFHKSIFRISGLIGSCRECIAISVKKNRKDNPEQGKASSARYRKKNTEKIKAYHARPDMRERKTKREKERRKTEEKFLLNYLISGGIRRSLKARGGSKAGKSWKEILPYTLAQLERRLKKTLLEGYAWQDFLDGNKLHVDHIIPQAAFKYKKPTDPEFQACWALKNLQLLPARENIRKGAKFQHGEDEPPKAIQMDMVSRTIAPRTV